jgi:hypothetical protein
MKVWSISVHTFSLLVVRMIATVRSSDMPFAEAYEA